MTDMENKILGCLKNGTPDDTIRAQLDASQAEIVMVKAKYPGVVKPKNAGAVAAEPAPVERPDAIKETDKKVQPKVVKQGPPRDENAERAKLAKIQGASAVVEEDKGAETAAGKKNEEAGELADSKDDVAPAAESAGVNPENVLDQNTRTVFKKLNKEKYPKEDLKALQKHEETTRKRGSIIKYLKKLIERYVNE